MATYKDILNEKENQNWLKGSLALRITKAGLRNLVEGVSYRVQQKIHSSINQARNTALGASCSLCRTENLILCPTKGLCSHLRSCKYHNSALKMFQPCPSQICDDFRDEICAVHRYGGPSWKNTMADKWCFNHWQVAKCFMPPDGYRDVASFDETDFNGIINFMINCTETQRSLSFNIANNPNQPNILTKARQIGRSIRHSPDLKVTDTDLADYFATLNTLLTDSTYLAGESNAQQAVVKLKQLERDALLISSDDIRELLEEARGIIETGKHELLQSMETTKKEIQYEVSKGKTAVDTGKRAIVDTVLECKTALATGKRDVEETVTEGKIVMETGKSQIEEIVSDGKTAVATGKREIKMTVSEGKLAIETGKREIEETVSEGKSAVETGKREIEETLLEGKSAVETGKREIEETMSKGKSAVETGKREIEETVSEGKLAIETGKRELEERVSEGKTAVETGKREIKETVSEGKSAVETGKREIEETMSKGKSVVETGKREIEETVSEGKSAVETGKREIEERVSEGKTAIETGKREIKETVSESKAAVASGKREIEETASEALQRMRDVSSLSNAEQKKDLRQQLAKFYHRHLNSAPISPLLSDKDERLDKFYVPPKIVEKDHRTFGAAVGKEGTPVTSYKQMFWKTGKFRKNIFVVGEAGMGKSSCAAMCALKWANQFLSTKMTNNPDANALHQTPFQWLRKHIFRTKKKLDDQFQDEHFYKEIEFLFHLTLRNSCDFCDLTDMIRDQLIYRIYQQDKRAAAYFTVQRVLSNNKCVIIVDGLDEWTHPNDTNCSCSEKDKVIPYLAPTIDATVLITSRPWRMSQQRVQDTKIDTYLEIEGAADIKLLLQKVINSLNETVTEKKTLQDFLAFGDRMNLSRLLTVPILSMLLVSLWFEGVYESFSLCDIYAYTIEIMFARKDLPVPNVLQEDIPLPKCFQHTENVRKYFSIVMEMAQLAFTTLFSNDQRYALVFKNVDILSHDNLLFVLKSGILQETKVPSLIRKSSSYSFIHKTVQEFLAAIYMSYNPEEFHGVFLPFHQKSVDMSNLSQIFIFMCGLNIELANELSALISNSIDFYQTQRTIVLGYKEAQVSQVLHIQLSLYNFTYLQNIDTEVLNDLLEKNKSKVRSIYANSNTSQATLQEVFSCSKDTLNDVSLLDITRQYDISACNCLERLLICAPNVTDIVVNSKNLFSLKVESVSKRAEYSIFQSLERESDNLNTLQIADIADSSFFCKVLPRFNHLKYLNILRTDFDNQKLIIPASVISVELVSVKMTARSLMSLVESLKNSTHSVTCLLQMCYVHPQNKYEKIRRDVETRQKLDSKIKDKSTSLADKVISIGLEIVEITAWSLMELVKSLENSTHSVECKLIGCTVDPTTEYEKIQRYIQTRETFVTEIKYYPDFKVERVYFKTK